MPPLVQVLRQGPSTGQQAHEYRCHEVPEVLVIGMGWCYVGQEADPETIPALAVWDGQFKNTYSHATLGKGVANYDYRLHTIQVIVEDITDFGYK